jgi:hypothetical protein
MKREDEKRLPLTEELDFHYLLTLLPPLRDLDGFEWLPEMFSIIGYEKLITLCRYAGGEVIRIPTIDELATTLEALQCFYDVYIAGRLKQSEIPTNLVGIVRKISDVYASNCEESHQSGASGL